MNIPAELKYTKEHEWIKVDSGTIGITDFAQDQLGDVVFIEYTAEPGEEVEAGQVIATIESVKTVSDIYAPMSGKIVSVNTSLDASPETVNSDPYGEGWLVNIEASDASQFEGLLTADTYKTQVES
ncbi:MAG: glycine cleavage system protein H [Deltaproteobacteria bacterium]|nr:glycine cleavage system protein H [Deltaproteobacteria bacterium]MBU48553.1 glycine cleavage system protein H [Deltaproteobacteria bacterium]|tara:strand:+ start:4420 stop:4797 length:378 start_codon:yes stop_codon:yes gene_type:complete